MLLQTLLWAGVAVAAGIRGLDGVDNLVVFGDSWTDQGRLLWIYEHGGEAPPPGTFIPPSNSTASGGYSWPYFASRALNATAYNYAGESRILPGSLGCEISYRAVEVTIPESSRIYIYIYIYEYKPRV